MAKTEEKTKAHPIALYVSGLLSPMSLRDQRAISKRITHMMQVTVFVSTVLGYIIGYVHTTFFAVAALSAVSLLAFGPNWYQNDDSDQKWCNQDEVRKYYENLEEARKEAMEKIISEGESVRGKKTGLSG
uniref:Microsomal signal peptidase 12 kDa subunit n=1 Tax=Trypanosoma congolense (strain IL3000) TaxID=1068625 RepID=G0UK14_TRYCI|nr:conserved hypothetical protein [Trypanosoma congolense IL3000]